MSETMQRILEQISSDVSETLERGGADQWVAVWKVYWFETLKEWCVCPSWRGYEWTGDIPIVAVFQSVELAFAFARILNQAGMEWVIENRHILKAFVQRKGVKE